jgi:hypothetical protein
MDEKYFPKKVEQKWQKKWSENGAFNAEVDDSRPKFYQLEMLHTRRAICTWAMSEIIRRGCRGLV